jgi:hypothetical protein
MGVCSPPASPLGRWGNKACKGDLQIVVIIAAAALLAAVCLAVKPAGKPDGGERLRTKLAVLSTISGYCAGPHR